MILSKKHRFIFIKGKKVAGTSMEIALSNLCGDTDIITPISPIDERSRIVNSKYCAQNYGVDNNINTQHLERIKESRVEQLSTILLPKGTFYNHMSLTEVYKNSDIDLKEWTVFGIERCPYAKVISLANMHLRYKNYQTTGMPMLSSITELKDSINRLFETNNHTDVKNINLYTNLDNELSAIILRYERLESDYKKLMSSLQIKNPPKLLHYKKGLNSNSINPCEVFTKQQISTINKDFAIEFDKFGYKQLIEL